jgi:hypothetical protein
VRRGNQEFRCTLDPGSRSRAPALRIRLPVDSSLTFHPGSFQAARIRVSPERDLDPLRLQDVFRRMEEVARELPALSAEDRWRHRERMRHSAVPTFLAALIVLLLGAALLWGWGSIRYPPVHPYRMFVSTLPVTALLFLPIALWMADRLAADMHALGRSMYLVVFLFLSVFVHGGAMILNGVLDQEVPRVHENLAVSSVDRSQFPARVRLESWDREGEGARPGDAREAVHGADGDASVRIEGQDRRAAPHVRDSERKALTSMDRTSYSDSSTAA